MDKMPEFIDGFSQVEYLTVFNAIIFGVIASEFFSGWGSMLRHRQTIKIDWLHIAWSLFAFLTLMQNWFGIWPRTQFINNHFIYFLWALIPMFLFHLISVIIFPSNKKIDATNFKEYFSKNAKTLYILFAIYLVSTIVGSYVYQDVGDVVKQNITRVIGILLSLGGIYFHNKRWYHTIFLAIFYAGLIQFILSIPL